MIEIEDRRMPGHSTIHTTTTEGFDEGHFCSADTRPVLTTFLVPMSFSPLSGGPTKLFLTNGGHLSSSLQAACRPRTR